MKMVGAISTCEHNAPKTLRPALPTYKYGTHPPQSPFLTQSFTSNMAEKINTSKPATTTSALPSKDEFLAYYFSQIVGRFNALSKEAVILSGLSRKTYTRVIKMYSQYYTRYIEEEQAVPPREFWKAHTMPPELSSRVTPSLCAGRPQSIQGHHGT